jgi:hypothetical protein
MKPTIQQVIDCQDEQQLNDWAAIWCMGWGGNRRNYWEEPMSMGRLHLKATYNPCQDGAQAFELLDMFGVMPRFSDNHIYFTGLPELGVFDRHQLKQSIVKASIISAIEEQDYD